MNAQLHVHMRAWYCPGVLACTYVHVVFAGFQSIDIPEDLEAKAELEEPYVFHFPDGNASIARLLVRALIPAAAAGDSMEDIVTAKFDYGKLDAPHSSVRIRLQSPVVRAENRKDGTVSVGYIDASSHQILHVQAKHVVLACFNMAIPYILPDLSEEQRKALKLNVKVPRVSALSHSGRVLMHSDDTYTGVLPDINRHPWFTPMWPCEIGSRG